ncbi:MAG: lactate utilization protein [Clostridiales bacterium]|nr:lactate utilization protein [Clostridiales bacterium]
MNIEKTIDSLKKKLYSVSYFETYAEAADYLDSQIDGKEVGFGDSQTLMKMDLYNRLSAHNTVHDPNQSSDNDEFLKIARECMLTQVFITSVNAVAETGEMVNIDGTGNRVAASLFGHDKVYFVVSTNKIAPDLEQAQFRARNVAAPKNAMKYDLPTPCVATGGKKCFDCRRSERICNAMVTYMRKMNDIDDVEVVLINDDMGY